MYETLRIVNKLKPKYVIWENVKNILSKKHKHNFDRYVDIMNEGGYTSYYQVLDAKDYGIPQHRERVFVISIKRFEYPEKEELKLRLKDMLEQQVDEKFYLTDKQIEQISNWNSYRNPINEAKQVDSDTSFCITAKSNTGLNASMLLLKEDDKTFVTQKYKEFAEENGYIPEMFNPYNKAEIKEIAPTQTSQCNSTSTSATVLIKEKNLKEQLCNKLIEQGVVHGGEIINHSYTTSEQRDSLKKYIESDNGIMPTMTTRPDILGVCVKNANKQGYDIATIGDSVNLQQPNSETRRGRVGHEVSQTLQTTGTMGVVTIGNYTPSNHEASRVVDSEFVAPTVKENHGTVTATNTNDLRIRKLTPKECWRLMGFTDEEFEKAEKVNSNAQLYKQAGNSIVVNVLEKILKNLIGEKNAENNNTIALQK